MEWLIAHDEEMTTDTSAGATGGQSSSSTKSHSTTTDDSSKAADKISAASQAEKELGNSASKMAAEKKITVEEARKIILERQAIRAEEERKQEIENEKKRRVDGQKMAEMRAEMEGQERIRLAQQIRKEKLEKELHKKQLLEQIARDREAMRQRHNPEPAKISDKTQTQQPSQCPKASPTECKIALRFPDGSNLVHKFSPNEQLSAVRLYVQNEKNVYGSVEFVVPPNKKFTNDMMNDTLESLGLCPASRLEVKIGTDLID